VLAFLLQTQNQSWQIKSIGLVQYALLLHHRDLPEQTFTCVLLQATPRRKSLELDGREVTNFTFSLTELRINIKYLAWMVPCTGSCVVSIATPIYFLRRFYPVSPLFCEEKDGARQVTALVSNDV
jgi:hypothetical protein